MNEAPDTKAALAALYTRVSANYGQVGAPVFAHAGKRLVELAGVQAGERVLDLAAGRGASLLVAAARVGPSGRAIGIDVAPGMVAATSDEIVRRGLLQAEMRLLDAERLDAFDDASFEHVLCGFAVFFFADLERVLRGALRVLVPGGRLGFAFSRGGDPRWAWYEELLQSLKLLDDLTGPSGRPGIRQRGALVAEMLSAGFVDVEELLEPAELWYRDADDWWQSLFTHGSVRPLERLAAADLERLRKECVARAARQQVAGGIPELFEFAYVLGRRPRA